MAQFLVSLSILLCVAVLTLWIWSSAIPMFAGCWLASARSQGLDASTIYFLATDGRLQLTFTRERYDQKASEKILYRYAPPSLHWGTDEWFAGMLDSAFTDKFGAPRFGILLVQSEILPKGSKGYGIAVSFWLLLLLSAALPAMQLGRRLRGQRRIRKGLCFHCGYDLRHSPDRCPECGSDGLAVLPRRGVVRMLFIVAGPLLLLASIAGACHWYVRHVSAAFLRDAQPIRSRYAIHLAARDGRLNELRSLLESGADISVVDMYSHTVLHEAILCEPPQRKEAVELVLSHRADPNAKNRDGSTPLHYAVEVNDVEVAEMLLKHGADPLITDAQGSTPAASTLSRDREMKKLLDAAVTKAAATRPARK